MPNRRDKQMQDMQMLQQMLALYDRFSPEQESRDSLLNEQLLSAIAQREQQSQMLPLMLRGAEADIAGAEQRNAQASQMDPQLLRQLMTQIQGQEQANVLAQSLQPAQVKSANAQADVLGRTVGSQVQSAELENMLKQRSLDMQFKQMGQMDLQTQMARQDLQQGRELHPAKMGMFGAQMDQLNLNNQMLRAMMPQTAGPQVPNDPSVQLAQDYGSGALQDFALPQYGDQIVQSMRANPTYAWPHQFHNMLEYSDQEGQYGRQPIWQNFLNGVRRR